MRSRWLVVVLVVSLALNAAGLGAVAYHRWREYTHQQRFFRRLQEGAPQRLKALYREHEGRMLELRGQYRDAQEQLYLLMTADAEPDSAEVETWLDRIAEVRKEMHRLMFESARRLDAEFPPEERERIHRSLRRMYRPEGRRGHRGHRGPRGRHSHDSAPFGSGFEGPPPGPPPGMPDEDEPIEP